MTLVGNEFLQVIGVTANGQPSGSAEIVATQDIANLALPVIYKKSRSWIINGIGDSITARNAYHPVTIPTTQGIPLWVGLRAYAVSNIIRNSVGQLFYCTTAGTTSGTEPTWNATGTTSDGSAVWTAYVAYVGKDASSFLTQAEMLSMGVLSFDQSRGYQFPEFSLLKVIVISGGSNYTAPTISFTVTGAIATVQTVGGVITGVTMVNCGRNASGALDYTLTDSTGSGAVLSLVFSNSGTFGVNGCRTRDMVARLPDVVASQTDIITVLAGTNDATLDVTTLASVAAQYAITIANLKTIYETLVAAGKKVVVIPILPRTGLTAAKLAFILAVNRWIRAYANEEIWANPNQVEVALADATRYLTDNSLSFSPVGGTGGTTGSVMVDGLHPSPLGAQYIALAIISAIQRWTGVIPTTPARQASYGDGASISYNPGGNILEGLPWVASTAYALGDFVANDTAPVKVYRVTTAGTSAASGGPTGTGGAIADGTVTWAYVRGSAVSVLGAGTAGTLTAAAGVVITGSLCTHLTLARQSGSSTGTLTAAIENPWSDGQVGQRQSLAFSLGSGTATEQWRLLITSAVNAILGVQATELANAYYTLEVEIEITGAANIYQPYVELFGQAGITSLFDGFGIYSGAVGGQAGYEILPSTGYPLTPPNSYRMLLRSPPSQLPLGTTQINSGLFLNFNTSGGAASSTMTIKVNNMRLCKVYVQ